MTPLGANLLSAVAPEKGVSLTAVSGIETAVLQMGDADTLVPSEIEVAAAFAIDMGDTENLRVVPGMGLEKLPNHPGVRGSIPEQAFETAQIRAGFLGDIPDNSPLGRPALAGTARGISLDMIDPKRMSAPPKSFAEQALFSKAEARTDNLSPVVKPVPDAPVISVERAPSTAPTAPVAGPGAEMALQEAKLPASVPAGPAAPPPAALDGGARKAQTLDVKRSVLPVSIEGVGKQKAYPKEFSAAEKDRSVGPVNGADSLREQAALVRPAKLQGEISAPNEQMRFAPRLRAEAPVTNARFEAVKPEAHAPDPPKAPPLETTSIPKDKRLDITIRTPSAEPIAAVKNVQNQPVPQTPPLSGRVSSVSAPEPHKIPPDSGRVGGKDPRSSDRTEATKSDQPTLPATKNPVDFPARAFSATAISVGGPLVRPKVLGKVLGIEAKAEAPPVAPRIAPPGMVVPKANMNASLVTKSSMTAKPDFAIDPQVVTADGQGIAASGMDEKPSSAPPLTPHTAPRSTPPPALQQVIMAAQGLVDGPVEVALAPEELGRVRLSLQGSEGAMAVLVQAERPETLDLLRRNIDVLATDLQDMGFGEMTFTFGDPNSDAPEPETLALTDVSPSTAPPPDGTRLNQNYPADGAGLDMRL